MKKRFVCQVIKVLSLLAVQYFSAMKRVFDEPWAWEIVTFA